MHHRVSLLASTDLLSAGILEQAPHVFVRVQACPTSGLSCPSGDSFLSKCDQRGASLREMNVGIDGSPAVTQLEVEMWTG